MSSVKAYNTMHQVSWPGEPHFPLHFLIKVVQKEPKYLLTTSKNPFRDKIVLSLLAAILSLKSIGDKMIPSLSLSLIVCDRFDR